MWIFANKNLEFRHPVTGETFAMRPKDFRNAPEWVEKDPLFAWALRDGTLTTTELSPEIAVPDVPAEPADNPAGQNEVPAEEPSVPKKSTGKRKAEPKKEADAE